MPMLQNAQGAQEEPAGVFVDCVSLTGKILAPYLGERITAFAGIYRRGKRDTKSSRDGAQPLMLFLALLAYANARNLEAVLAKVKALALRRHSKAKSTCLASASVSHLDRTPECT